MKRIQHSILSALVSMVFANLSWADVDLPSKFSQRDGVANTRHNLTQSTMINGGPAIMNPYRNDYGEVCVYCHTPHGSSSVVAAPLWNRTRSNATYTTYDQLGTSTLTQQVTTPGVNSITCLSCHDGTLGVDSIINMPTGNGNNYDPGQETTQNNTFLNSWTNASGADASSHLGLNAENESIGCLACHSANAGIVGAGATDFRAFAIGTDLRNDHPVGVRFPVGNADFNTPNGVSTGMLFFDDGNGRANTDEIRLYDTGDGPEVECASCHDPHGVAETPGAVFNNSFLRVSNDGSGVCLTCHNK